jgi:hypothetical protein
MRSFLLSYDPFSVAQAHMTAFLDTRSEVRNWFAPFVGTLLLVAPHGQTPSTLTNMIRSHFPTLLLTVIPIDSLTANGWMPPQFWNLLNEPKSSGRWEAPGKAGELQAAIQKLLNVPKKE